MKIYNVFHPNLFWKTSKDPLTDQQNKLALLVITNNEKKWEVEDIIDASSLWGKIQYWVKSVG